MTTGVDVSLQAILDCVALPVWVVDHDGLVVLANPAAIAVLGYDELSSCSGRHGHDTVHYKHRDGSPYPADECPVLEPARTGRPVHRDEDWFIRRDGTFFPVSFTSLPIELPTGRGVVVTFSRHDRPARGRAGAARARRDPRPRRAAGLGRRPRGPLPLRQPGGAAPRRLRRPLRARRPARARDGPLQVPRRPAVPGGGLPADPLRAGGREPCRTARTGWCARTARSCASRTRRRRSSCPTASGSVTAFTDIEEQLEAEQAARDARHRRGARGGAARRPAAHHRGRRRRARPAHPRPARRRAAAVRQRHAHAPARGAQGAGGPGARRRAAARSRSSRPGWASPSCATSPPASIPGSSPTAASAPRSTRSRRGSRCPSPSTDALQRRLPPRSRRASTSSSPRRSRTWSSTRTPRGVRCAIAVAGDRLVVDVRDDGIGGAATCAGGTGLAGLGDRIAALDGR